MMGSYSHNQALLPILRLIAHHAPTEEEQWVLLESLCLGIGKLHQRSPRDTALYIETMSERIATGERT